jgi:DNA polymerase-3 subunit alpha
MREAIKKIIPTNIDDLIALGSLYRPGPMDNIPSYISRKHGKEKIEYVHPYLEPILKETHGIIVYQEQVMEIAKTLAGYKLGEADLLRRAMGKKIKEEMEAHRNKFIDGCMENKIDRNTAEDIFNLVNKFASYGFNKSHAAAYAYISYQTAYLKANFPLEFLTAYINLEIDNTDKIYIFITEAKKFGIKILLPDINYSKASFTIEGDKIRFGLAGIKGVGAKAMNLLVEVREKEGKFKDIFDFFEKLSGIGLNKKTFENLVKSGSFYGLGLNKKTMLMNADILLKYCNTTKQNEEQLNLFFDTTNSNAFRPKLEIFDELDEKENLKAEFDVLGYYLSTHPLKKYKSILKDLRITEANDIDKIERLSSKIKVAGVLLSKKVRSTPRGKYAFLQISDLQGIIDIAIFSEDLLYKSNDILVEGRGALYFSADLKKDSAGLRIVAEDVKSIDNAIIDSSLRLTVIIKNKSELELVKDNINYTHGLKINLMVEFENKHVVTFKYSTPILLNLDNLEVLKKAGIKVLT